MGKFPHSTLHNWFSDWHFRRCSSRAWLTDVDVLWLKQRIWAEIRFPDVVAAAFDLKLPNDRLTHTEKVMQWWFEQHAVPFYTVTVQGRHDPLFTVHRQATGETAYLYESSMRRWIDAGMPADALRLYTRQIGVVA